MPQCDHCGEWVDHVRQCYCGDWACDACWEECGYTPEDVDLTK